VLFQSLDRLLNRHPMAGINAVEHR